MDVSGGKRRARPRGQVMIWTIASLVLMIGVLSLCVDWGLKTMVDGEVVAAADAAAIAGAQRIAELPANVDSATRLQEVRSAAINAGQMNPTAHGAIRIDASDVEVGRWDHASRSFAATSVDDADSVRVTVERSSARGNGVQTSLARAFGISTLGSRRRSTAQANVPPRYALLGLEAFTARGLLTVSAGACARQGHVASNGDVQLNLLSLVGVTLVDGEIATLGRVQYPTTGATTIVREGVRRPERPFALPAITLDHVRAQNDNGQLGSLLVGSDLRVLVLADLPGGTYLVNNFTVTAGAVLRIGGQATIYVRGDVTILGSIVILSGSPGDLKIRVAGSGQVLIAANVSLAADVYAPSADATIAAGVVYRGRLMARTVTVLGTSLFVLSPDLPAPEIGRTRVALVT